MAGGAPLTIAVTGGSGFIGSAVVRQALARGDRVVSLIRECEPVLDRDRLEHVIVDWTAGPCVASALGAVRPDLVVHCAGSTARGAETADAIYEANVATVWRLLSAVAEVCPAAGVVVLSSAAVYGPVPDVPTSEDVSVSPITHYAASKILAEQTVRSFAALTGVRAVVARPFNVLGPGEPGGSVIQRIARQVACAEGPTVAVRLREVRSTRDFVDVDDTARALLMLAERGEAGGIYNVCSGTGVSIAEVVAAAADARGVSATIEVEDAEDPGTVSLGDPSRLAALGWTPTVSLRESLQRIISALSAEQTGSETETPA